MPWKSPQRIDDWRHPSQLKSNSISVYGQQHQRMAKMKWPVEIVASKTTLRDKWLLQMKQNCYATRCPSDWCRLKRKEEEEEEEGVIDVINTRPESSPWLFLENLRYLRTIDCTFWFTIVATSKKTISLIIPLHHHHHHHHPHHHHHRCANNAIFSSVEINHLQLIRNEIIHE